MTTTASNAELCSDTTSSTSAAVQHRQCIIGWFGVKLKDMTLNKCDPSKGIHIVDYGPKRWIQTFEQAAETAQQLAAQTWNDEVLKIMMKLFSTNNAQTWVTKHRAKHQGSLLSWL